MTPFHSITTECFILPFRESDGKTVDTSPSYGAVDVGRQKKLNSWLLSMYDRQMHINDSMATVIYKQSHGGGFGNAIRGLCSSMLLVALFNTTIKSWVEGVW